MAADRDHPSAMSGQPDTELPPQAAMTGVVQPRGRAGVELRCLVCGHMFTAGRSDRSTRSRRCGPIDATNRRATDSVRHCSQQLVGGRSDRPYYDER
jgi:hypothetical protein